MIRHLAHNTIVRTLRIKQMRPLSTTGIAHMCAQKQMYCRQHYNKISPSLRYSISNNAFNNNTQTYKHLHVSSSNYQDYKAIPKETVLRRDDISIHLPLATNDEKYITKMSLFDGDGNLNDRLKLKMESTEQVSINYKPDVHLINISGPAEEVFKVNEVLITEMLSLTHACLDAPSKFEVYREEIEGILDKIKASFKCPDLHTLLTPGKQLHVVCQPDFLPRFISMYEQEIRNSVIFYLSREEKLSGAGMLGPMSTFIENCTLLNQDVKKMVEFVHNKSDGWVAHGPASAIHLVKNMWNIHIQQLRSMISHEIPLENNPIITNRFMSKVDQLDQLYPGVSCSIATNDDCSFVKVVALSDSEELDNVMKELRELTKIKMEVITLPKYAKRYIFGVVGIHDRVKVEFDDMTSVFDYTSTISGHAFVIDDILREINESSAKVKETKIHLPKNVSVLPSVFHTISNLSEQQKYVSWHPNSPHTLLIDGSDEYTNPVKLAVYDTLLHKAGASLDGMDLTLSYYLEPEKYSVVIGNEYDNLISLKESFPSLEFQLSPESTEIVISGNLEDLKSVDQEIKSIAFQRNIKLSGVQNEVIRFLIDNNCATSSECFLLPNHIDWTYHHESASLLVTANDDEIKDLTKHLEELDGITFKKAVVTNDNAAKALLSSKFQNKIIEGGKHLGGFIKFGVDISNNNVPFAIVCGKQNIVDETMLYLRRTLLNIDSRNVNVENDHFANYALENYPHDIYIDVNSNVHSTGTNKVQYKLYGSRSMLDEFTDVLNSLNVINITSEQHKYLYNTTNNRKMFKKLQFKADNGFCQPVYMNVEPHKIEIGGYPSDVKKFREHLEKFFDNLSSINLENELLNNRSQRRIFQEICDGASFKDLVVSDSKLIGNVNDIKRFRKLATYKTPFKSILAINSNAIFKLLVDNLATFQAEHPNVKILIHDEKYRKISIEGAGPSKRKCLEAVANVVETEYKLPYPEDFSILSLSNLYKETILNKQVLILQLRTKGCLTLCGKKAMIEDLIPNLDSLFAECTASKIVLSPDVVMCLSRSVLPNMKNRYQSESADVKTFIKWHDNTIESFGLRWVVEEINEKLNALKEEIVTETIPLDNVSIFIMRLRVKELLKLFPKVCIDISIEGSRINITGLPADIAEFRDYIEKTREIHRTNTFPVHPKMSLIDVRSLLGTRFPGVIHTVRILSDGEVVCCLDGPDKDKAKEYLLHRANCAEIPLTGEQTRLLMSNDFRKMTQLRRQCEAKGATATMRYVARRDFENPLIVWDTADNLSSTVAEVKATLESEIKDEFLFHSPIHRLWMFSNLEYFAKNFPEVSFWIDNDESKNRIDLLSSSQEQIDHFKSSLSSTLEDLSSKAIEKVNRKTVIGYIGRKGERINKLLKLYPMTAVVDDKAKSTLVLVTPKHQMSSLYGDTLKIIGRDNVGRHRKRKNRANRNL